MASSPQPDQPDLPRWGTVSTIKAGARDILNFAGYHLEAGASQLFLYLDAPCPEAMPHLRAHPAIRVFNCTPAFWEKRHGGRPEKHQARQSANATRTYRRFCGGLDWLTHIDADEFIWSEEPVAQLLCNLPASDPSVQVRPVESLGGSRSAFKAAAAPGPGRAATVARAYPGFGEHLKTGFLSHTQGKVFLRTGLSDVQFRIHHGFQNGEELKARIDLPGADLCHLHGKDWDDWHRQYGYRLQKGSYRAELSPARPRGKGGVNLHDLLSALEAEGGTEGLQRFYQDVCADTPALRARLEAEGLLRIRALPLDELRRKHFPDFG